MSPREIFQSQSQTFSFHGMTMDSLFAELQNVEEARRANGDISYSEVEKVKIKIADEVLRWHHIRHGVDR